MKVYRVEHIITKRGPFIGQDVSAWAEKNHDNKPSPKNDGIKNFSRLHVCGFESMESLHAWFSHQEMENLKKLGYVVAVYEAKSVKKGAHQVAFMWKHGKKLEVRTSFDLFVCDLDL